MRRLRIVLAGFFAVLGFVLASAAQAAPSLQEALAGQDCVACHAPDFKLVGPAFSEIAAKYADDAGAVDKLVKSVRDGSSGKWGETAMPPHPNLSESQVKEWVSLILSQKTGPKPEAASSAESEFTDEDIQRGLAIFQGTHRLQNGGPACNSCHHVKNDAVIGGGVLAKELTTVFSRVSGQGVKAILGAPPFPVMQQAYQTKPITEEENRALVAFLQYSDKQHFYQQPRDYGMRLFNSGLVGLVILFAFYGLLSLRRKKRSVNHDIYQRQEEQLNA